MRKGKFLCAVMIMTIVLTACGLSGNKGSETQTGHEGDAGTLSSENENENGDMEEYKNPEDGTVPTVYEYEADIIRYREPVLGEFTFRKDVKKTETAHAVYYFETVISEQERQACIAAAERAFGCMDGVLPKIEIVVLTPESYDGVSVVEHRLYTSLQAGDFADFVAACLLTAYGEWGNYGMAYGYADHLCREARIGAGEEAGIDGEEAGIGDGEAGTGGGEAGIGGGEAGIDGEEAGIGDGEAGTGGWEAETDGGEAVPADRDGSVFWRMSSPELYDLNLLCFDERFATPEDVEAAKKNACCFVETYLSAHTEQEFLNLLSDSGTAEGIGRAKEALEAFYTENGVECSLTEIRYQYGGVVFDYAAACEYASFYIEKDWQDRNWEANPKVSEHFLHEDYGEVKAFFECNVRQMGQYRELFDFDRYENDLTVFFSNGTGMSDASFYQTGKHTIYLKSVVSLMHEYIHALMDGRDDPDQLWACEGFARNYDCLYNEYAYDFWNDDYNHPVEGDDFQEIELYRTEYIRHIGRPIDIRIDYRDFGDFMTYACGWDDPNATYQSGASFVAYLADCYGEQAVIRYVGADKSYHAEWGKSYEELVQDWQDYICETYSWYGTE
ncbi:MAG: hypothetical protein NC254_05955 [bacterium]|nr:hypothetical protein [bacterium]